MISMNAIILYLNILPPDHFVDDGDVGLDYFDDDV